MVFIVEPNDHRWRRGKNSQKGKKSLQTSNIGVKLSSQFAVQSACETITIGSHDYEAIPVFKQKASRRSSIEEDLKLFEKFAKNSKTKTIGPGSYEISQWPEIFINKTGTSVKKNFGFGTTSRFLRTAKFSTPGPGYVGVNHNPYYFIENKKRKGLSTRPTFEFDGLAPRIPKIKSVSLAPNRYKINDPHSLDNFIRKQTGKRGPYDLFTGPRDYSSVKGYFTAPEIFQNSTWPKKLPGEIEKLLHKSNNFKGIFGKSARFPKLGTIGPGPGHYNLEKSIKTRILKNNNCPFGKSLEREKKLGFGEIRPCPGQYDPKMEKIIQGSGWRWIFRSKLPRIKSLVKESYNSF